MIICIKCSDFWVFDTPIYPEWIPNEETRAELERGAHGESVLSDELKELLVDDIMRNDYDYGD